MPLSKEEQAELDALEAKVSSPYRVTPKQMQSYIPKGRQLQSAPRTLAYGPQFQRGDPSKEKSFEETAYEAGGQVTDITGSPLAGTAVRMLPDVALSMIGGLGGGSAASVPLKAIGRDLMQSALKPTLKQLKSGDAAVAIDTMLDRGFNATKGGVEKIKAEISKLNDQIKTAIASSNEKVSIRDVGQGLMTTLDKFSKQVNPEADMAAVRRAWDEFKNHPLLKGESDIPVQMAQELKQGTYKQLSKKYGQMGSAEVESQKTLARGLKEQIAEKVPEIQGLNKQESDLIKTLGVAERRSLMELNKNPMGLSLLTQHPGMFAAYMADKSALFKSLVARMAYSGAKPIGQSTGAGGVSLYELSRQNAGPSAQPF